MGRWRNLAALLVAGLLLTGGGCRHASGEQRVRDAIAASAQAARASDARALVAFVEDDFSGNAGELDRSTLRNMVRALALQRASIGVQLGSITTETRGSRIVAKFAVTLTSGNRMLPAQTGSYQVETAWRADSGEWRCYTASWQQVP